MNWRYAGQVEGVDDSYWLGQISLAMNTCVRMNIGALFCFFCYRIERSEPPKLYIYERCL